VHWSVITNLYLCQKIIHHFIWLPKIRWWFEILLSSSKLFHNYICSTNFQFNMSCDSPKWIDFFSYFLLFQTDFTIKLVDNFSITFLWLIYILNIWKTSLFLQIDFTITSVSQLFNSTFHKICLNILMLWNFWLFFQTDFTIRSWQFHH
jgi:hypothetical protein